MKMKIFLVSLTVALLAAMPPAIADDHRSAEWRIIVKGKSTSNGKINFELTSAANEDGTVPDPVSIEVMVPAKTKQKDIQGTIVNNFRATLGDERFKITTSGSEKVTIKAKKGTPWFTIELTNNTVQSISLQLMP